MAKKVKKTVKRTRRQVWRFIDYDSRWGGDFEKLPKFIKWYINCWDGSEGPILAGINMLRAQKNFIWLQGALIELLTRVTNVEPEYQGYILSSRMEPATVSEIGRMLRVEGRGAHQTVLAALTRLSEAGFLEEVEVPRRYRKDADPDRDKLDDRYPQSKNVTKSKKKKKTAKKPQKQPKNADEPFKGQVESLTAAQKEIKKESRRQFLLDQVKQMQAKEQPQAVATTTADANSVLAPTTTPPMSSTSSDGGQARRKESGRKPAPTSLGRVLKMAEHRYDIQANEFADEVLVRTGYFLAGMLDRIRMGIDQFTDEQFCERGHWSKAWTKVTEQFGSETTERLRTKMYKKAEAIRHERCTKLNPESYMMTAWNNLVRDEKRKGKCKAM